MCATFCPVAGRRIEGEHPPLPVGDRLGVRPRNVNRLPRGPLVQSGNRAGRRLVGPALPSCLPSPPPGAPVQSTRQRGSNANGWAITGVHQSRGFPGGGGARAHREGGGAAATRRGLPLGFGRIAPGGWQTHRRHLGAADRSGARALGPSTPRRSRGGSEGPRPERIGEGPRPEPATALGGSVCSRASAADAADAREGEV